MNKQELERIKRNVAVLLENDKKRLLDDNMSVLANDLSMVIEDYETAVGIIISLCLSGRNETERGIAESTAHKFLKQIGMLT